MCSHVPNKGEQMVRYYGYYSNVIRGKLKKKDQDGLISCILEPVESLKVERPDGSSKEYRRNWARLIQKIYEVDPLTCPKCLGKMKIISVIEDEEIIKRILKHLSLWDSKPRPPPKPRPAAERTETIIDDSHRGVCPYGPEAFSQLPAPDNYPYVDPQYLSEA